jgi:transglutaminase-like putative cysteine protease
VSRREFRSAVSAPRPASAWALVSVASATLWVTGQLDPWVLAVQPLLLLATLARRTRPFEWQRSPVALNAGMIAIVTVTIAVALRGGPSTIALAHFAALTQALQLLDARPRRTEFLLVALALFQVVLAANLTDSPWLPPLLLAFLLAVVWTLLVHTLRSEALEAGDPRPVQRALTPGLLRTTALASAASIVLAMLLFVALPRLRSSVVYGPGFGTSSATAGFSDEVQLGDLGRIRQDATVVMRVETLRGGPPEGSAAYWRGLAFDHFDGTKWAITPAQKHVLPGSPEGGIGVGPDDRVDLVQRIVREPVAAGVIFGAGEIRGLQGNVRQVRRDVNGGLYALGQDEERIRYSVGTHRQLRDDAALGRDRAVSPAKRGEAYLQLPPGGEAIRALARELTQGLASDAERMRALEAHLLRHGRYSDTPPRLDPSATRSPVEAFLLGEMAAHCEYFASALVWMARSIGIPARLVNGFAGGRRNRIGDFVELTRSDAHTWVEVHYADAGWVRYDATPADLRARPVLALSWEERFRELGSALELWWYQRVIGFDRADQIQALKQAYLAWRTWKGWASGGDAPGATRPESTPWRFEGGARGRPVLFGAVCAAALLGLALRLRRRTPRSRLPVFYGEALRLLARRGLERAAVSTARDFARHVAGAIPEAPAAAFDALTEAYLAERFGARPGSDATAHLQTLRAGLRQRARA